MTTLPDVDVEELWNAIESKAPPVRATRAIQVNETSNQASGLLAMMQVLMSMTLLQDNRERNDFIKHYSWVPPSRFAIRTIKRFAADEGLLSVGSGKALWEFLLCKEGCKNVIASDNFTLGYNHVSLSDGEIEEAKKISDDKDRPLPSNLADKIKTFMPVERLDAVQAIEKHPECQTLMLIYPPQARSVAVNALRAFKGKRVVFIGEGAGGCTADDKFFQLLKEEYGEPRIIAVPQWPGSYDEMFLYTRKASCL